MFYVFHKKVGDKINGDFRVFCLFTLKFSVDPVSFPLSLYVKTEIFKIHTEFHVPF